MRKKAGVLAHFTSLPSTLGVGDLGSQSYAFLDLLKQMHMSYWQVLPIGQTDDSGCPYATDSAFGAADFLFSPEQFVLDFKLEKNYFSEIKEKYQIRINDLKPDRVNYPLAFQLKKELLKKAFHFFKENNLASTQAYLNFLEVEKDWVHDYALFRCFKEHRGYNWKTWPTYSEAHAKLTLEEKISFEFYIFTQYIILQQLKNLKAKANAMDIKLIGDLPIFVSYYSLEVWRNPQEFLLNKNNLNLEWETGAAPDAFSDQGQKWGTPYYDFKYQKQHHYNFWQKRIDFLSRYFDVVRIDHFRGFQATWLSRTDEPNAKLGHFEPGPGADLFSHLKLNIEIIAEDLGVITPDVEALRDQFQFPGMRVLEFMLGDAQNPHKIKNYIENCIAYSGTHDCDTLRGWFEALSSQEKTWVLEELQLSSYSNKLFIEKLLQSPAKLVIVQLQDLLDLGSEARFNYPSLVADKNWTWKTTSSNLSQIAIQDWAQLVQRHNR